MRSAQREAVVAITAGGAPFYFHPILHERRIAGTSTMSSICLSFVKRTIVPLLNGAKSKFEGDFL